MSRIKVSIIPSARELERFLNNIGWGRVLQILSNESSYTVIYVEKAKMQEKVQKK